MYRAVPWLIASALLVSGCQSRPAPTSPTGNRPAPNTLIIDASQGAGGPTVTWSCLAASVETPAFGIFSAALSPCPAARVRTLSSVDGAPLSAPAAPSGLSSTVGGSTVNLFWSAGAGADPAASYMVEAGSAPGLANLANFDTGNSAPALTATGVGSGTYYVRVRSKNAAGVSAPSNEAVLVVGGACGAVPNPASGLVATSSGSTVTLVWSAPAGGCPPAAYFIEAGSAPGLSNLANFSTGNAATTFGAGGVGNGTYYVRVRSGSPAGKSAPSNEAILVVGVSGGVPPTPAPAPAPAPAPSPLPVANITVTAADPSKVNANQCLIEAGAGANSGFNVIRCTFDGRSSSGQISGYQWTIPYYGLSWTDAVRQDPRLSACGVVVGAVDAPVILIVTSPSGNSTPATRVISFIKSSFAC